MNAITMLSPYRHTGQWVFDDEAVGLVKGNWYWCPELEIEGWLCPALFRYFEKAPAELYVKVEGRK